MTTITQMIDEDLKHCTPRSPEYRRGIEALLRFKFGGEPIKYPYPIGTPQADAFISGNDRGWMLYKAELRRRQDKAEQVKVRAFFADADAL